MCVKEEKKRLSLKKMAVKYCPNDRKVIGIVTNFAPESTIQESFSVANGNISHTEEHKSLYMFTPHGSGLIPGR